MRRRTKLAFTLIVAFVPFGTFGSAVHAACNPGQIGTSADCPDYTAPSTTAVPGPSMGGHRECWTRAYDVIRRGRST
jgi:hypothetical protein